MNLRPLAACALALLPLSGCSLARASEPDPEIRGTVTWSMTREFTGAQSATHESLTTTVRMELALKPMRRRGGVSLYQGDGGGWVATGRGRAEETAGDCTRTRATNIDVRGSFAPPANLVTLLHNQSAKRALLNFSVSKGDGAVLATTHYCDGGDVTQNTTYFWAVADAGVDVTVETDPSGVTRYLVSKDQSGPCGPGATCTRTARGVLTLNQ
jgi:hypothetical protein